MCNLDGEYTSNKFYKLFAWDGTIHQISCINNPEQNGVAERKHRHIVETAHSLLLFASVPSVFWGKVVLIMVGLINIIVFSHILGLSFFEKLYEYAPDILSLEFFIVFISFFVLI